MEQEINIFENASNGIAAEAPGRVGQGEKKRTKTSQRLKYEAECEVLKRKLGDLEQIRGQLQLSQRKICQLLLVDPSAWTRWTKMPATVPPHIYRMLQWYLALQDKYPALDVSFWLSTVSRVSTPDEVIENKRNVSGALNAVDEVRLKITELEHRERANRDFEARQRRSWRLVTLLLAAGSAVFGAAVASLVIIFLRSHS